MATTPDAQAQLARAEQRRQQYTGEVVARGTPKPPLYSDLTLPERLAHMTALVARQAAASGTLEPRLPRSQRPGTVFRIGDDT